jgi:protein-L-isoaspartate O-methyltransferase
VVTASGWEEKGAFDAIVVTAAAKSSGLLWRQLREGGRLVMPSVRRSNPEIGARREELLADRSSKILPALFLCR